MRGRELGVLMVVLALGVGALPTAPAQAGVTARAGLSFQPDQFVLGGQVVVGHVLRVARFAPSIDVGFGDDVRTLAVNGDVLLPLLPGRDSGPALYVAMGPTLTRWDFQGGGGDTEIGWSLVGGIRRSISDRRYGLEVRFGVGDIADLKILLGLVF